MQPHRYRCTTSGRCQVAGLTINDIVLALCAGALRRYLAEHAARRKSLLTAGVPALAASVSATRSLVEIQVAPDLSRPPTDVARAAAAACRG